MIYKQASLNHDDNIDFTKVKFINHSPKGNSTAITHTTHAPLSIRNTKSLTSPVEEVNVKESNPVRIPLYNTESNLTSNDELTYSYNNLICQLERLGSKMPLVYQKTKDVCPIYQINYKYEIHDKRNYDNIPNFTNYYYHNPYKDGKKIDMNPYNVFSLNVRTRNENMNYDKYTSSCRLTQIDDSGTHDIPNSHNVKENSSLIDNFYKIDDIKKQFGLSDDECTEMFNTISQRLELSNIICDKLINEPLPNKNDLKHIRSYINYTSNADKNLLFSYSDPMKNPVIKQFLDIPSSEFGKYGLNEDFYNYDADIDLSSYLKDTNIISLDMSDLSDNTLEQ